MRVFKEEEFIGIQLHYRGLRQALELALLFPVVCSSLLGRREVYWKQKN
jgi:hypothetical protein